MNLWRTIAGLALLTSVSLTACTVITPAPTIATATAVNLLTDRATATAEATRLMPTGQPQPADTATSAPEPTVTNTIAPTQTPSPTPQPEPVVKVNETLTAPVNVRAGPGTNYPVIGQFQPGQAAPVTGQNSDESWWQVSLPNSNEAESTGWVYGQLVTLSGDSQAIPVVAAPLPPTPAPQAAAAPAKDNQPEKAQESSTEQLADQLRCGKDFCVTYQAMVPIWENGGCIGNHSIYITVLQGLPPGQPMDGVVIGDTFNNVEVASGDKGPGQAEVTLWMNSMSLYVKRNIDGTPYTSEESFNFTSHDELIPAEVLAANGYCEGSVDKCRQAQQQNQVCRGHYSWRVTFHKFD